MPDITDITDITDIIPPHIADFLKQGEPPILCTPGAASRRYAPLVNFPQALAESCRVIEAA